MVTFFSPIKQNSKKCFDGYMPDGKKRLRFVEFKQERQDKLAQISKEGEAIAGA